MTAEHICAIALQIGRQKDSARVLLFIDSGSADIGKTPEASARYSTDTRAVSWEEKSRVDRTREAAKKAQLGMSETLAAQRFGRTGF